MRTDYSVVNCASLLVNGTKRLVFESLRDKETSVLSKHC